MQINASLLSLLTIDIGNHREVFFAYRKELDEVAPDQIFWYPGRGKDGISAPLWSDKSVRQWIAIGTDGDLRDIWEKLLYTRSVPVLMGKAAEPVTFTIATITEQEAPSEEGIVTIPGIPRCTPEPVYYKHSRHLPQIAFLIDEKNNCSFLEGYQTHPGVKPMLPAGLLSDGNLYQYLLDKIVAVYQPRRLFYHLYEQKVNDGTKRLRGFIQADQVFRQQHHVVIKSDDGTKRFTPSGIDLSTGAWLVENVTNDGEGQFILENIVTGKVTCGERYAILRNIKINAEIVHAVITDLFNRKINISDKWQGVPPSPPAGIRWDGSIYPDIRQAEIELSDRLTEILLALGSHVIINDPYFLGDVKAVDDNIQFSSQSQLIFFNALIIAMGKSHLKTLSMIGYWKKAKTYVEGEGDGAKEAFIERYRQLAAFLQRMLRNVPDKQLVSFDLVFARQTFHDRYWLPNDPSAAFCYHVSNSVNGPIEQNELKITKEEELNAFKEVSKIMTRLDGGETIKLLR